LYAKKILELLDNDNLRNKIIDGGYRFIKTFSYDNITDIEIYDINK